LWTRSNCEQLVHDQLRAQGFAPFLPATLAWSRRAGVRRTFAVPLFPGYLFLRDALDRTSLARVLGTRGVVRVLGERWEQPAVVPDEEVEAVRRLIESRLAARAHPYLREGRRLRILHGPLAGLEGILLRLRQGRGLLVLSVNLLQRSVAVEVDCADVAAD
jgi:transcription antitermination factor NusG